MKDAFSKRSPELLHQMRSAWVRTPETRARIGESHRGLHHSAETKRVLSEKNTTLFVEAFGREVPLIALAKIFDINPTTLRTRIVRLKWPIERACTVPTRKMTVRIR